MSKITILYHPDSSQDTLVNDYLRDYRASTGKELNLLSLETKEGDWLAQSVDATQYPAIIVSSDDGSSVIKMWQGEPLPLISEVSYYDNPS